MKKEKNKKIKVVLAGGHAGTTAIAVIEKMVKLHQDWDIYWIGPKKAISGKRIATLESKVIPTLGVTVNHIVAGKLQRKWTIHTLPSLAKIPFGFIHAFYLLIKIRPKVIVSFGGYSAFPVVFVSWILRIYVISHEQGCYLGLANRLSAPFVSKIALARQECVKHSPKDKAIVIGNPVMQSILNVHPKKIIGSPAVIYIAGGSRGSQIINQAVSQCLQVLLNKYIVIHQTGELDYKTFLQIKKSLPDTLSGRYELYPTIDPMQMGNIYKRSDVVVGRSGANTVSEVIMTKRPAVFIPYPWLMYDEQTENAKFAVDFGIARLLPQSKLNSESLIEEIDKVVRNYKEIVSKTLNKESPDIRAADNLVHLVENALEKRNN